MNKRFRKGMAILVMLTFLMQSVVFTSPAMLSVYAEADGSAVESVIDAEEGTQDVTTDATELTDSEADLEEGQPDGEQAGLEEEEQESPVLTEQEEPVLEEEEPAQAEEPAENVQVKAAPAAVENEEQEEESPAKAPLRAAAQAPSSGTRYLAFTSDIHNSSNNTAANRLNDWYDYVIDEYGQIDYMGFCGDMGAASANESQFWTYTNAVKTVVDNRNIHGFYTTGNHEYYNGRFKTTTNDVKDIYTIGEEDPYTSTANYRVYALGTTVDWGVSAGTTDILEQDQIDEMVAYLAEQDGTKPIIVLAHFPLHHFSSRTTTNANAVITALNNAAARGLTIIYLWGHNHTLSDTFYDEIYGPGDTIPYSSSGSSEIQFYYAAAGCMSDSEYSGSGSSSVKGKGLVIQIRDDDGDGKVYEDDLGFAYYSKDGQNATENKDEFPIVTEEVDTTGMSLVQETLTVTVGATENLTLSFTPSNATDRKVNWTSSDETIATVSSSGVVTGVKPGTVTITATHVNGGYTDTCEVTVKKAPGQGATPETGKKYVILANDGYALTSEGEEVGYHNGSGDQVFYYYGLSGEEYTIGEDVAPDRLLWTFTASEDGTGYYIQDQNGKYLNGTYEANNEGGSTGTLKLDDTPDVWIISGAASGSTVSAHILKSTNASATASSDKYLTHGNGDNGGDNTNIFTLRSEDNATTTTFYEYTDDGTYVPDPDDPTPEDPPTGTTVDITPTTDNPEKSIKINVGDTLVINVTNGSTREAYDFTATIPDSSIAEFVGSATVNVASGGTGQITVKGLAEGTVDITISNNSTYGDQYSRKGVIHLTVGEGTTPVDPPTPSAIRYIEVESLTDGGEYIIAVTKDDNSVYAVRSAGGSNAVTAPELDVTAATGEDAAYIETDDAAVVWKFTASDKYFANDGVYFYPTSSRGVQTYSSGRALEYADGKMYFESNSSGRYYLTFSDGAFNTTSSETSAVTIRMFEKTEVSGEDPVESVELNKTELTLTEGDSEKLTATVKPATAADKSVTWTSSDETVATVDQSGNVTAVKEGTATITVTTTDGGKTAECAVTVSPAPEAVQYVLTDTLEAGKEYLIVNDATVGSSNSRALKNPGGTSSGASPGKTTVMVLDGNIIETNDTDIVWTAVENGDGVYLMNNGDYLEVYQGNLRVYNPVKQGARYWTYADNHLTHRGGSNPYYVTYSNGSFAYSSSAADIYLFVKEDGTVHEHTWGEWMVTTPATCSAKGIETRTCSGCDETETREIAIDEDAHDWGEWTVTTPATETEDGVETRVCANDPSHTETRAIPATGHTHDMVKVEATEANCMTDGNIEYWTCTKCGKFYSDEAATAEITEEQTVIPKTDHNWGDWQTLVEPTCTEKGVKVHTCSYNAMHMETADIPATGHQLVKTDAADATCTAEGNTAYWTCSACGKLFSDEQGTTEITLADTVIPMTEHAWGEWTVTTPAACEEDGVETRTCSTCGEEETRAVEATGHTWGDWTTVTAATCSATGSEERVCTKDPAHKETREIAVNTNAHAWGEWQTIVTATCTEKGVMIRSCTHNTLHTEVVEIPAAGHNLAKTPAAAATCTAAGNSDYWTCGVCGKIFSDAEGTTEITIDETVIPMLEHGWSDWETTTPATCEAAGEETRTCSVCNESETREIAALGHDWGAWEVTTPATETTDGVETSTCARCGETQTRIIPVIGHTHVTAKVEAQDATCEKEGNIEYWICSGCGKYFADEAATTELSESDVIVAKTEHAWGDWQMLIEPTCTDKGVRVRSCGYNTLHKEVEELAPTGHATTHFGASEANCEQAGNIEYWSCSNCGKTFSDEACTTEVSDVIIKASGHDWSDWTVTKAATCSEAGVEERVCANDPSHKESQEIAIDGSAHTWGEWESVTDATCTRAGIRKHTCIYNSSHMEIEEVPATEHQWGEWTIVTEPTCGTAGSKTRTCSVCHEVETAEVPIDAEAHDWSAWTVLKKASCGENGIEFRTCANNSMHKDFRSIDALSHKMTKVDAKAATCTKAGNIEHYVCSNCGNYYSDAKGTKELQEVTIPATGHDMVVTDMKTPTATKVGSVTRTCSKCGEKDIVEIPRTKLAKPVIVTDGKVSTKTFDVTWKKIDGATNYQVAYRKAGTTKWTTVWAGNKTKYTISGVTKKGTYQIKVRAYRKSDGTYSSYSKVKYRYMMNCSPVKATSTTAGKIKVTYAKDTSASGYKIVYSTSSKLSNATTIEVKGASKVSYTISGLKSGKTYYVVVRPYKVVDGKTYIGVKSTVVPIKVK